MTNLVRDLDQEGLDSLNKIEKWKTTDQGAATLVIAGFDPSLSSGECFSCFIIPLIPRHFLDTWTLRR
jgi:hypothetical protein